MTAVLDQVCWQAVVCIDAAPWNETLRTAQAASSSSPPTDVCSITPIHRRVLLAGYCCIGCRKGLELCSAGWGRHVICHEPCECRPLTSIILLYVRMRAQTMQQSWGRRPESMPSTTLLAPAQSRCAPDQARLCLPAHRWHAQHWVLLPSAGPCLRGACVVTVAL
jgi:hypothetical protein